MSNIISFPQPRDVKVLEEGEEIFGCPDCHTDIFHVDTKLNIYCAVCYEAILVYEDIEVELEEKDDGSDNNS